MSRPFAAFVIVALALWGAESKTIVTAVDSIGLTVSDLDRSVAFYTEVLSFEKVSEFEADGGAYEKLHGVFGVHTRTARLRLGNEFIELTEFLTPKGRPAPVDGRSNDGWFQHIAIITGDMGRAYAHLRRQRVEHASPRPQRLPDWNRNAGGIEAFYFKDPDGHPLEVLQFPAGKGDSKWHSRSWKLFLGIDHTAIAIRDTDSSLRFYRDTLGLRVVGESDNYGMEQERLNNVFGAHLRITALRAGSGPGVEFLEYLTPRDGRPYPADERPNDLVHWQTRFRGADAESMGKSLSAARAPAVSAGVVEVPESTTGFRRALTVRDPDGHAVQIVE